MEATDGRRFDIVQKALQEFTALEGRLWAARPFNFSALEEAGRAFRDQLLQAQGQLRMRITAEQEKECQERDKFNR